MPIKTVYKSLKIFKFLYLIKKDIIIRGITLYQ